MTRSCARTPWPTRILAPTVLSMRMRSQQYRQLKGTDSSFNAAAPPDCSSVHWPMQNRQSSPGRPTTERQDGHRPDLWHLSATRLPTGVRAGGRSVGVPLLVPLSEHPSGQLGGRCPCPSPGRPRRDVTARRWWSSIGQPPLHLSRPARARAGAKMLPDPHRGEMYFRRVEDYSDTPDKLATWMSWLPMCESKSIREFLTFCHPDSTWSANESTQRQTHSESVTESRPEIPNLPCRWLLSVT